MVGERKNVDGLFLIVAVATMPSTMDVVVADIAAIADPDLAMIHPKKSGVRDSQYLFATLPYLG